MVESEAQLNTYEFPLKKEHQDIMVSHGLDIDKIIALRRNIHQFPEKAFEEFETSRKIKEQLISFGIDESDIHSCATTGYFVDI